MVLGNPVAGESGLVGELSNGRGCRECISSGLVGAYGHEVEDREFEWAHTEVNTMWRAVLPSSFCGVGCRMTANTTDVISPVRYGAREG